MSSFMEMSLDDIIQKRRRENIRNQRTNKPIKNLHTNNLPITDARQKIILKKRTQIRDAREKLTELAKQRDARLKLERLRQSRGRTLPTDRNVLYAHSTVQRIISNRDRVFVDRSRQVMSKPLPFPRTTPRSQIQLKRFIANKSTQPRFKHNINQLKPFKPIVRTVENDIEVIEDDPMDEEYIPQPTPLNRKSNMQFKIVAHNNTTSIHRTAVIEEEKSPPRPPSILKKRPMATLASDKKTQKPDKNAFEYRIIVSNLRNTVTGGDIEELFGDVGGMVESRLVRPGTAEVIYKTQEDAQRAVELYHNRQLDGQPMNCLLVAPRSSAATSRSSTGSALYSTNSNVEPDISTFHKVLFSNL